MIPACMLRKVFGIVRVFLILLEVQLGQMLAGVGHRVIYSPVVETLVRSVHLDHNKPSSVFHNVIKITAFYVLPKRTQRVTVNATC